MTKTLKIKASPPSKRPPEGGTDHLSDQLDGLAISRPMPTLPPEIREIVLQSLNHELHWSSLRACLTVSKEFHAHAQPELDKGRKTRELHRTITLPGYCFPHQEQERCLHRYPRYNILPSDMQTKRLQKPATEEMKRAFDHVRVAYMHPHDYCGTPANRQSYPVLGLTTETMDADWAAYSKWHNATRPMRHVLPKLRTIILARSDKMFGQRETASQACVCYPKDQSFRLVFEKICSGLLCHYHLAIEALTAQVHTIVIPISARRHSCCFKTPMEMPRKFRPKRCVLMFEPEVRNPHWPSYFSQAVNPLRTRMPSEEPRPCINMFYRMAIACFQVGDQCKIIVVAADHGALRLPHLNAHDPEIRCTKAKLFTDPVALACYGFSGDLVNSRSPDTSYSESDIPAAEEMIARKVAVIKALLLAWVDDILDPCEKPAMDDAQRSQEHRGSRKNGFQDVNRPIAITKKEDDREDEEHRSSAQALVDGWLLNFSSSKRTIRHFMRNRIKFMTLHEYHMLEGDSDVFPTVETMI